ncbi:unnamed protein product [Caenorhabditis angaria]|uniref:Nose resistant-to-fluoxetine protein N-terminal domain-containing protein n=1 Tax=Caenorhabditis angaria TaxID=860376 RepID=A0A9P1IXE9_9PELO|nr:unnamed protein product [Caenorhabditis angaria]
MQLILFLFLIPYVVAFTWQDVFTTSDSILGLKNITDQCANDTSIWISSLEKIGKITSDCLKHKICNPLELLTLKNDLFAIQQLDAFAKFPVAGVLEGRVVYDGSYQECERVSGKKYETNYCYLVLRPGKNADCNSGLMGNISIIRTAVCMPKSCGKNDLATIFNQLTPLPLTACSAYCSSLDIEKDTPFWGFTIFMCVMVGIALLATLVDFVREKSFGISSQKEKILPLKILLAFSFWTNAGQLLAVKEQKPGYIKSLDCIRAISMSWVVAGHGLTYIMFSENLLPVTTLPKKFWNHLITNAVFSVDTFFLLSGIVLSYMFFKERPKGRVMRSPVTWIMYYIHRYLRLTPPMMIFIGFFTVYAPYIQGPFAASTENEMLTQTEVCKTMWWQNLLYINNFNSQSSCYAITWYLAVDTQLYIIAPILIIALYFSFTAGALLTLAGCIGSIITVYILYGIYDLPATFFGNGDVLDFNNLMYDKPWIRCTPYLIGILVGYLIAVYGKRKIRLNWVASVTLWIVAVIIAAACLFSTFQNDKGVKWSVFERATYYNLSRIGWSLAVSWVIVANHMGWGGPIDNFMSHPIWQPFGRLSYCAYLVHWMVLYYFLNLSDQPIHYYSIILMISHIAIPATILSYIAAFFWSCLFEVPVLKLEKLLFSGLMNGETKKVEPIENGISEKEIEKTRI